MNMNLNIQPFNDFWMHCFSNTQISVLSTIEPSYKYAAYLNNYHYEVVERKYDNIGVKSLLIFCMQEVYTKYLAEFFVYEPFNFKDEKNYVEIIKELLKKDKLVTVGVDLFHWIPFSFSWGEAHWDHYSLIKGFDEEKQVFYVLDGDITIFGTQEIPVERFCKAVESLPLNPHGYLVSVPKNLKPFELKMSDVKFFAKKLVGELEGIDVEPVWRFNDKEIPGKFMFQAFCKYVFQIVQRHTGNILLFKTLQEMNLISDVGTVDKLVQHANELKKDWQSLERSLAKNYFLSSEHKNFSGLCDESNRIFRKEIEMWNAVLELP